MRWERLIKDAFGREIFGGMAAIGFGQAIWRFVVLMLYVIRIHDGYRYPRRL